MTVAIIVDMTLEENIEKLEEERQRVVMIIRFCFWTPIITVGLCYLGVLPPILSVIVFPSGIIGWSLHIGDRERLESAIDDLKKRSDRKL